MDMKGGIRNLASAALLATAVSGCAWIEPRTYDLSDQLQSRGLLSQCAYRPESAERRRNYPLVVESSNWFFREASVELYDPKGKMVAKTRLPDFAGDAKSFSVRLENVLISPGSVLRVTNSENNQVDFYFDPELIAIIPKKEDVTDPSEFIPFDLYYDIKEAGAVLKIPTGVHAAARVTLNYLLNEDAAPECAGVAKSLMYFGGKAKKTGKR